MRQYEISVVGVTFDNRQEDLAFLYGQQEVGVQLVGRLRREPENKFDPNAVAVDLGAKDSRFYWSPVGYVPKALAMKLAAKMDGGTEIRVTQVKVVEGDDSPTYGVRITVQYENDEEEAVSV